MGEALHGTFLSADNRTQIHTMEWIPEDGNVRGILQLVHGMQEFIDRYDDFAKYMNSFGFVVVGNDHLGHGKSILSEAYFGYFAEKNGNRCVIQDMRTLQIKTQEKYPEVPYFMLGHSMGSFLCRQYLCQYSTQLDGAIISGTAFHPKMEAAFARTLCKIIAGRKGWMYRSPFMTNLAMGGYNKKFEPIRTPQDWLTRDEQIVDAYRADKRTQFQFTMNGFYNMFTGLLYIADSKHVQRMRKDLPVLFIAGEMDPVGSYGEGVKKVVLQFRGSGMQDVSCKLYPNDRHEVLNELNKAEVYSDISSWIENHMHADNT